MNLFEKNMQSGDFNDAKQLNFHAMLCNICSFSILSATSLGAHGNFNPLVISKKEIAFHKSGYNSSAVEDLVGKWPISF